MFKIFASTLPSTTTSTPSTTAAPGAKPKKICCACPDTKKIRDACIVEKGEVNCKDFIDAHNRCLRSEGFNV